MPRQFYCAKCGMHLKVYRKAMPNYGRIIDLIEPHECLPEPIEPDFKPIPISNRPKVEGNDFVQKLNDLSPPPDPVADLRDRRPSDQVKSSSAPAGLTNLFDSLTEDT